ncbi:DUF3829 domain-containing protein [Paraliomyxa miuraensis]|uniref:DUF3829 domain-containing protein n=1 Tax=Paraliomyxa miuraensis TaxID=376150 RepID=UPI00224D21CD|nr:DUF3829 domain-containing protein [Paraliomyxa miuraensis]MCX4243314.1 YiiG family protein [Paraliomyxa miuraensis]
MPSPSPRARLRATLAAGAPLGLALGLGLGATPGCEALTSALEEKAQEVAEEMGPPDPPPVPPEPALTEDEQLSAKLALYIECRDRASRRIRESWAHYDERVGEDGTPRKKGLRPYLHKIDTELRPCEEAVAKGPTTAPPLPEIEAAMARYLQHAKAFGALAIELDAYYNDEGYTQDRWAKGKELAPTLRDTWQAWDAADTELHDRVDARKDVVDRAMLTLIEERQGKDIEWHTRSLVLATKGFVRCATVPDAKGATGGPADEGCADAWTTLQQAEADFRREFEDDPTRAESVFWMSAFEGSVTDFMTAATAVATALQQGPRKGKPTAEARAALVDEHEGLVSDFNNLRFER